MHDVSYMKSCRGQSGGAGGEMLDAEMESELIKMGIASPVTKSVAGALYHQQLSRQVP